ncbi:serine hydrolase domain-containing protein [Plantactinospora soyae]|uniref:D-alanyl-D-alanine carboxypeptidase n=1 Tax=Plantactinospora soyae TaxID=1544732 RepID=A0A927M2U0_9ACTN|nr:serine hydrolase domain-containing protein [Plantactinospora soyae]MBE1485741.1 D-alanyl-D-alanine carboxypeptidase [Plantactinospora soyae]
MTNRAVRIAGRVVAVSLALALLGAVAPATANTTTNSTPLQHDVDRLHALGVTGVFARLDTGHGVEVARSGVADLDTRRPVPRDPYLRIGSTTKTYVAVVVLQLVAEGRLSLSDPVERWLPGVVAGNGNDGRTVTVRQLLQHTSGLRNYTQDLVSNYVTPETYRQERWRTYTPGELVAMAMSEPPSDTTWAYSNTNYVLAGMLIEAVTGHGWEREVQDRIIRPLGLRHTRTPGTWPFLPAPHATNYQQFTEGGPLVDTTIAVRGLDSGADGSMVSKAGDLNAFFAALIRGRLLPPAQLAQMRQMVAIPDGNGYPSGSGDGLGLFYRPLSCGGGYWGHGGNGFGYTIEPAVSDDGSRRITVSLFTGTIDRDAIAARAGALNSLIDRAICG